MFTTYKVENGEYVEGIRLEHGDMLKVSSGGLALDVNVGYKAELQVGNGGIVSGATIAEGGEAIIYKADAYAIRANSGAELFTSSSLVSGVTLGGSYLAKQSEVYRLTVNAGGSAYIADSTVVDGMTVNENGYAVLSSGATIVSGTVQENGVFDVNAGGVLSNTTFSSGSWVNDFYVYADTVVTSGALALNGAYVNRRDSAALYAGQSVRNLAIDFGGLANINAGASAADVSVLASGGLNIHSGAAAAGVVIGSGAYTSVFNGGAVSGAVVSNGGDLRAAGAVADARIYDGGKLSVLGTGKVEATAIAATAVVSMEKGANLNGLKASAALSAKGGNVSGVYVDGDAKVIAGQTVYDVDINAKGNLAVNANGVVSGASVNADGKLNVLNGGVANYVTANAATAAVTVASGGKLNNANVKAGTVTLLADGQANDIAVNGGTLIQKKNAVINGFTADVDNTYNGTLIISSSTVKGGKTANLNANMKTSGVRVADNGTMNVNKGGNAAATEVAQNGQMNVYGSAAGTIIRQGGKVTVVSGGVAAANKAEEGAVLVASNGGVIADTVVNTAAKISAVSGGVVSNATVSVGGAVSILNGGVMKAGSIENGVKQSVSALGSAYGVVANNGTLILEKDAYGSGNIARGNGKINVSGGAAVDGSVLSAGGIMNVSGGAAAKNTTVKNLGKLNVSGGAVIEGLTLEAGANVNGFAVANSQTADKFLLNNAVVSCHTEANLYAGQSAAKTMVSSDAVMNVYSGGVAVDTTVSAGTVMAMGGVIQGASVVDKGLVIAHHDAEVKNVKVNNGELFIYDGSAENTVVNSFGTMVVEKSGKAVNTSVANGTLKVAAGADADGVTVKGGKVSVAGTAEDVTLYAGTLTAEKGAALKNTVVSGGTVMFDANTTHSGTMFIAEGSTVMTSPTTTIDFTVAGRTAKDSYIINNVSRIDGMAVYTVTTDTYMAEGSYKLAQGASAFTGTLSVKDTSGAAVSALDVNGDKAYYKGSTYAIKQNGGNLTLNIADQESSSISANGVSQIIAWDAKRGAVGMVATGNGTPAEWKGIWDWSACCGTGTTCCTDKWKVVGTGRFAGTAIDTDGILLYNRENNTFAAWTDLSNGSYGYVSLCHVEDNFSVKSVVNFNNNEFDDVLIYDEKGNFGIVLDGTTYKDVWHVDGANNIKLIGAGYFGNANGTDSIVVLNTDNNKYYLWNNSDITFASWAWDGAKSIGKAENDWEIAGIGDFAGDGIDDIVVMNNKTGYMFAWENGDSSKSRWVGAVDAGDWEVAAVGDYNGDGKDDLLLRELITGWGGLGYWGGANADNWVDLNARVENNKVSNFAVIA